jgi:DNA-directed RNA polymerase specialized sigma24 family protein
MAMRAESSITHWIAQLKTGNADAAEPLWEAYFPRLVELARGRLVGGPRRAADEEDVALSAFHSFCARARAGRFPRLADRHSLWPLLVVITARKCAELFRRENRQKRRPAGQTAVDLETLLSQEPTPDFAAQAVDELDHLLGRLDETGDPELRRIAQWKMEGDTTEEVAQRLGCVRRTVERKLALIVRVWEREG